MVSHGKCLISAARKSSFPPSKPTATTLTAAPNDFATMAPQYFCYELGVKCGWLHIKSFAEFSDIGKNVLLIETAEFAF